MNEEICLVLYKSVIIFNLLNLKMRYRRISLISSLLFMVGLVTHFQYVYSFTLNKQSISQIQSLQFDGLIVPQSSFQTYTLYEHLKSYYGKSIISGQTTKYYDQLKQLINQTPVIQGFDMQNYSPHNPWFGWKPVDDGTIKKAIQWYYQTNKKGIFSFQWHWFSPMGGQQRISTFYTNNTNFNLTNAIITGTQQNIATLRDIDAISVQLKRLQDQNIPILWRPLHQAGGGWFWWGSKTSKQTLKLLDIIQARIINYHQIHNLIWIWSTPQASWYPGNTKLDIMGYDSYPGNYNYTCQQFVFDSLKRITQKLIGFPIKLDSSIFGHIQNLRFDLLIFILIQLLFYCFIWEPMLYIVNDFIPCILYLFNYPLSILFFLFLLFQFLLCLLLYQLFKLGIFWRVCFNLGLCLFSRLYVAKQYSKLYVSLWYWQNIKCLLGLIFYIQWSKHLTHSIIHLHFHYYTKIVNIIQSYNIILYFSININVHHTYFICVYELIITFLARLVQGDNTIKQTSGCFWFYLLDQL